MEDRSPRPWVRTRALMMETRIIILVVGVAQVPVWQIIGVIRRVQLCPILNFKNLNLDLIA
jgi:hypothetical protein